jgi:RNA polymerase sigma-70 factor, ECF subfamily
MSNSRIDTRSLCCQSSRYPEQVGLVAPLQKDNASRANELDMSFLKIPESSVTTEHLDANSLLVGSGRLESSAVKPAATSLNCWMVRYQQADPEAPSVLIVVLSPKLLRFFRRQVAIREQADDLLQETWLRIHRVRHTYRPGEPVLPWVYAIARRVGIDAYRRTKRITAHECAANVLPEQPTEVEARDSLPEFDALVAALPVAQREVVTMMKVRGLSLDEVARATSSSVGAVKQKAHRAYEKLRKLLESQAGHGPTGAIDEAR